MSSIPTGGWNLSITVVHPLGPVARLYSLQLRAIVRDTISDRAGHYGRLPVFWRDDGETYSEYPEMMGICLSRLDESSLRLWWWSKCGCGSTRKNGKEMASGGLLYQEHIQVIRGRECWSRHSWGSIMDHRSTTPSVKVSLIFLLDLYIPRIF